MANDFDVCIIGSGVAGGILAAQLAATGKRVAVVEAGTRNDRTEMQRRIANGGAQPFFMNKPEHLHVPISIDADCRWPFMQNKEIGGNTVFWGAVSPRPLEEEFRMKSADGVGENWPLTYAQLEPYYCRAEEELGVSGASADGPEPSRSKGFPLPPFPISYVGQRFAEACAKLGFGSTPIPVARPSQAYKGRPVCCLAGTCSTCPSGAKYSSDLIHVRDALASPNVVLFEQTIASRLITDSSHRVTQVLCNKPDRSTVTINAGVFIVACNAIESARLLLLSTSKEQPRGLANASGRVGKHLMSHAEVAVAMLSPEPLHAIRTYPTNFTRHFERGAHRSKYTPFRITAIPNRTPTDVANELIDLGLAGAEFARTLREKAAKEFGLWAEMGVLPYATNRIELDHDHLDYFGNPGMSVSFKLGAYERGAWSAIRPAFEQLAREMKATILDPLDAPEFEGNPHQLGTVRMGTDSKSSVVNTDLRAHDIPNLFMASGGVFPNSLGPTNPTLTIAALSLRLADYLRSGVLH